MVLLHATVPALRAPAGVLADMAAVVVATFEISRDKPRSICLPKSLKRASCMRKIKVGFLRRVGPCAFLPDVWKVGPINLPAANQRLGLAKASTFKNLLRLGNSNGLSKLSPLRNKGGREDGHTTAMNATTLSRRPLGCLKATFRQIRQQKECRRLMATAAPAASASTTSALKDHNFCKPTASLSLSSGRY